MNILDIRFYSLLKDIKDKTYDQLFEKMKLNYMSLPKTIKKTFEDYFDKYQFWGKLSEEEGIFDEIEKKCEVLKFHLDDFRWLYEKLEDYSSKYLLYAILNNWINYDFESLQKTINYKYNHYFDLDILPNCQNEVFVDVGTYTGDTIEDFLYNYSSNCYKRIYCYEITKSILKQFEMQTKDLKNLVYKNNAVLDKNGYISIDENIASSSANQTSLEGSEKIKAVTLDRDIKDKITMLKMDIEGDEEKAILGAKRHIAKDSPKLLISVYHKNEHYVTLAKLIDSFNPCYKFYLRNYGGNLYPTEIVLYAIIKN